MITLQSRSIMEEHIYQR